MGEGAREVNLPKSCHRQSVRVTVPKNAVDKAVEVEEDKQGQRGAVLGIARMEVVEGKSGECQVQKGVQKRQKKGGKGA